jgi:RNA polymerase sigma-70 factor (ECF subfamily)
MVKMETASLPAATAPLPAVKTASGFQDLYERHSATVYRTALRVTGNAPDAEDVLQNVFLRIVDRNLAVDPDWCPEGYLRRAATNASIDLLRRKSKNRENSLPEGFEPGARETPLLLKERLRRALAELSQADAEMFVLCYLEGYSYAELSELLEMEPGTVASRLFRIRAALREQLSK